MTPLILSFSDAATLGLTLTASGTGAIFGNSALAYAFAWSVMHCVLCVYVRVCMCAPADTLSLWGGPKRRVLGVLFCALFQGFLLASTGLVGSALAVLVIAFVYMATVPLVRFSEFRSFASANLTR